MMKLRGDPEKKLKDYSMPCEKPSNECVYDVRTRATADAPVKNYEVPD